MLQAVLQAELPVKIEGDAGQFGQGPDGKRCSGNAIYMFVQLFIFCECRRFKLVGKEVVPDLIAAALAVDKHLGAINLSMAHLNAHSDWRFFAYLSSRIQTVSSPCCQ
ncbi:hypothetical protein SHAL103562_15115 [Shewanella algae]